MITNAPALQLIAAVVKSASVEEYLKLGDLKPLYDTSPWEREVHLWLDEFVREFGKIPSSSTMEKEFPDHWGEMPEAPEPPEFYRKRLSKQHIKRRLVKTTTELQPILEAGNEEEALERLGAAVSTLKTELMSRDLIDIREAGPMLLAEMVAKATNKNYVVQLGWPTLDEMMQGLQYGDLMSIVGRPGTGKTYQMLSIALNMWKTGIPIMFISMEMKPILIIERIAAMESSIAHKLIKGGILPTIPVDFGEKLQATLVELEGAETPFWIVDGQLTATVDDVVALCQQLKPRVVLVDGAYLLQNLKYRGMYEKIAQNVKELKMNVASMMGIPVVASWQFNKQVKKLMPGEVPGLEHIGHTDMVGQLSSVVLGLFQEDNTPESIRYRKVSILKGRSGEVGEFWTMWDFKKMNFGEVETKTGKLVYVN